jgi:hypothetical protein
MGSCSQEQIAQYTGWLQEWSSHTLGPGYQVSHRYFGYDLPFRWEIRSHEPRWRWTLALKPADLAQLRGLSEPRQREFLCARLNQLLSH